MTTTPPQSGTVVEDKFGKPRYTDNRIVSAKINVAKDGGDLSDQVIVWLDEEMARLEEKNSQLYGLVHETKQSRKNA